MLSGIVVEPSNQDYQKFLHMTDWERFGISIKARLYDGTSALEAISQMCPDIVFVEITLPDMDGFALMRQVKQQGLSCDFILMSSYRRFDYAKNALRLGAKDYWVKPLKRDEVLGTIEALTESKDFVTVNDVSEYVWKTRMLLRNSFMDMFTAGDKKQELSLEALNKKYRLFLRDEVFLTVILVVDGLPEGKAGQFIAETSEEIRTYFIPICYDVIPFMQGSNRITLILNCADYKALEGHFSKLETIITDRLRRWDCSTGSYCIGIGEPEYCVQNLPRTLITARRALCCGLLRGWNTSYQCEKIKFDTVDSGSVLTPTLIAEMKRGATLMKTDLFSRAVHSAYAAVSAYSDPKVIVDIYSVAVDLVIQAFSESGQEEIAGKERRYILQQLGNQHTLSETFAMLLQWTQRQFDRCLQQGAESQPVREAKDYIARHYMEPLTLKDVAKQVYLHANYLSALFKKTTGQNFSEYLTDYRMVIAKKLLLEGNMTVAAISKAVGYEDHKYFSRIFAQVVGMKPSEYRMLYG